MMKISFLVCLALFIVMAEGQTDQSRDGIQTTQRQDGDDNDDATCNCTAVFGSGQCAFMPGCKSECYNPEDYYSCSLCSDPLLTTMGGEEEKVHPVGYMQLAKLDTKCIQNNKLKGKCEISVTGVTGRRKGDIYLLLIEFHLLKLGGGIEKPFTFRILPTFARQEYVLWIDKSVAPGGRLLPWSIHFADAEDERELITTYVAGCKIRFNLAINFIFYADITCCGTLITFRTHLQAIFWVHVRKDFTLEKEWDPKRPVPMCLDENSANLNISTVANWTGIQSHEDAMLYESLVNADYGLATYSIPGQKKLADLLMASCNKTERAELFEKSAFMLKFKPFIREYNGLSRQNDELIKLFTYVTEWFCQQNATSCMNAVDSIRARAGKLMNRNDQVMNFVENTCPPP